jgi:hypothetical protein
LTMSRSGVVLCWVRLRYWFVENLSYWPIVTLG